MGKTKDATKPVKATKGDASMKSVKGSNVTKPTKPSKGGNETITKKVVDTAKAAGTKVKQAVKAAVESDDDTETSDSSASSASDSEEEVAPKSNGAKPNGAKANGKANGKAKAVKQDSDDESDGSEEESDSASDSDEDSEDEAPPAKAAKANGAKVSAKKAESSDESEEEDSDDSEDSDEEEKPSKAAIIAQNSAKTDSSDSEEDESDASDDSSEDDDEEEEEKPQPKKRKAVEETVQPAKKSRVEDVDSSISPNLFVGSLSWNVDETMLREHFESFGTLKGARVMTDRQTGKSKGFGYVEFEEASDAKKAYESMKDTEIDGRTINLDYAKPNPNRDGGAGRGNDRAQQYGDTPSEPSATLFVGNVSFEASEEMLHEAFGEYGNIMGIRLPTDQNSGAIKGYGYVEFSSVEEATAAFDAMKGYNLAGRPIRLDYSTPRAGGGGGGRGDRGGFGDRGGRGRGGFGGRGDRRGGFGDRGGRGRGGGRGGFGDRGGRGGRGGFTTNRGGFGDFKGSRQRFD